MLNYQILKKKKKLKEAVNNTGATLRMSLKMFDGNNLPHYYSKKQK